MFVSVSDCVVRGKERGREGEREGEKERERKGGREGGGRERRRGKERERERMIAVSPRTHTPVNSVQWAPHEWGLTLACASSDESFSIVYYSELLH